MADLHSKTDVIRGLAKYALYRTVLCHPFGWGPKSDNDAEEAKKLAKKWAFPSYRLRPITFNEISSYYSKTRLVIGCLLLPLTYVLYIAKKAVFAAVKQIYGKMKEIYKNYFSKQVTPINFAVGSSSLTSTHTRVLDAFLTHAPKASKPNNELVDTSAASIDLKEVVINESLPKPPERRRSGPPFDKDQLVPVEQVQAKASSISLGLTRLTT